MWDTLLPEFSENYFKRLIFALKLKIQGTGLGFAREETLSMPLSEAQYYVSELSKIRSREAGKIT